MKWRWYTVLAIVGCSVGAALFQYDKAANVVYMHDDHFEPQEITVSVGDTVSFVSKTSESSWPASDAHPSHYIYSEFDPQGPIANGESWEFTFNRPGSWKFHDHIHPDVRGVIHVADESGDVVRDCVEGSEGVMRAACWEDTFRDLIAKEGVDAAFDVFMQEYRTDSTFRGYCHDTMHYVGRAAYETYELDTGIVDRSETSMCGYGFYHGFIEAGIEAYGNGLEPARQYCESVYELDANKTMSGTSEAANACWHGIGHAVFDSLDGDLWGDMKKMTDVSLEHCEEVLTDPHKTYMCSTGVFNSLVNAMINNEYELLFNLDEGIWVCENTDERFIEACYIEVAGTHVNSNNLTLSEGIEFARSVENKEVIPRVIFGVVDDTFRRDPTAEPDVDEFISTCAVLEGEEQASCLLGTYIGIKYSSSEENRQERLGDYCQRVSGFSFDRCEGW